jgi:hypothetical protein
MLGARKLVPKAQRKGFDSIVFVVGWILWKERNARTFDSKSSSLPEVLLCVLEEARLWFRAGYRHVGLFPLFAYPSHPAPALISL